MPKKLFYLDDQEDTLSSLETIFYEIIQPNVIQLKKEVGTNQIVQAFMNKIEEENAEQHYYILDINMPVPKKLKLKGGIWPQNHLGDNQYCGIALAKWLHTEKEVPKEHIALLTHWVNFEETHKDVLSELQIDGVRWVAKHQIRRNLGNIFEEWREKS
jgi:hypothetical protein